MRYTIRTLILCPNLLGIYTNYVFKILRGKKSLIHLKDSKMLDCHLRSTAQNARSSSTKRISLKHEARNKRQRSDMLHPYHKPDVNIPSIDSQCKIRVLEADPSQPASSS